MGIINVTPDSFSQDGCMRKTKDATSKSVDLALKQIKEGADIIDIGGESSRPGADKISESEEGQRIIPVIKKLAKKTSVPISADTYKSNVAKQALDAGASIINLIQGHNPNKQLLKAVRDYDAAIVLMHMVKTPKTMQINIYYKDLIKEIIDTLRNSIKNCLELGIKPNKIIIDPGIGFGKTAEHNLKIINQLNAFQSLNHPVLIGTSRKSFIGKVLGGDVQDQLIGTVASVCAAIVRGAHIVRVHDVAAIKKAVVLTDSIMNEHIPTREEHAI